MADAVAGLYVEVFWASFHMSGGPEDVIESTVCNKAMVAGWLVRLLTDYSRAG